MALEEPDPKRPRVQQSVDLSSEEVESLVNQIASLSQENFKDIRRLIVKLIDSNPEKKNAIAQRLTSAAAIYNSFPAEEARQKQKFLLEGLDETFLYFFKLRERDCSFSPLVEPLLNNLFQSLKQDSRYTAYLEKLLVAWSEKKEKYAFQPIVPDRVCQTLRNTLKGISSSSSSSSPSSSSSSAASSSTSTSTSSSTSTSTSSSSSSSGGAAPGPRAPRPPVPLAQEIDITKQEYNDAPEGPLRVGQYILTRKPPGEVGEPIKLATNFFRVGWKAKSVYQYLVKFGPDDIPPENQQERRRTLATFKTSLDLHLGFWWFTNAILNSTKLLPQRGVEGEKKPLLHLQNEDGKHLQIWGFKADKYQARAVRSDDRIPEFNHILNALIKKYLRERYRQFRQWYFHDKLKNVGGEDGLALIPGFEVVVHPSFSGLQMCIDIRHRLLQAQHVRAIMDDVRREIEDRFSQESAKNRQIKYEKTCVERLRGRTVQSMANKALWRVDDIDFSKNAQSTYTLNGEEISHQQYMERRYPKLPKLSNPTEMGLLVHFKRTKKMKDTEKGKELPPVIIYLVPDQYLPTGMDDRMRSNGKLMKAVANHTRLPPSSRVREIQKMVQEIKEARKMERVPGRRGRDDTDQLEIADDLTTVKARIMPDIEILSKNERHELRGSQKDFTKFLGKMGFFDSADRQRPEICCWVVVCTGRDMSYVRQFCDQMYRVGQHQGIRLPDRPEEVIIDFGRRGGHQEWDRELSKAIDILKRARVRGNDTRLLMCALPTDDNAFYSFIKQLCAVETGIISQCVTMNTIKKSQQMIASALLKQILNKMGFPSWTVNLHRSGDKFDKFHSNAMIVGIDVNMSRKLKGTAGGDRDSFATYSFTASYTPEYNVFHSYVVYQQKREDIDESAKKCMRNAMEDYKVKNGKYPGAVVVFRDGVSDGQLSNFFSEILAMEFVIHTELSQTDTKLTVIVCQKGVSARFFLPCPGSGCKVWKCERESYHAPPPGSVVDNTIVSLDYNDFYLVPSGAPRGACSRPTRFIVLRDDLQLSHDALQGLANGLCYLYQNWGGPIRVPAPVMYAHKLGHLFAKYLNGEPNKHLNGKLFYL